MDMLQDEEYGFLGKFVICVQLGSGNTLPEREMAPSSHSRRT